MEKTNEAGQILLSSLYLLEISPATASREYGCTITKDMFVQPNQKGLNTVLYLLFERIKGKESFKKVFPDPHFITRSGSRLAKSVLKRSEEWRRGTAKKFEELVQEIKGCWPVKDAVHQREFNKTIQRLVTELSSSGYVPKHLAAHLLQAFRLLSGFRLTAILCFLAATALAKATSTTEKTTFKDLPSSLQILEPTYLSLRSQNALQRSKFIQSLKAMSASQSNWDTAAEEVGTAYHTACQELSAQIAEGEVKAEQSEIDPDETTPATAAAGGRASMIDTAMSCADLWKSVEEDAVKQKELHLALESILGQDRHPHAIDSARLLATDNGQEATVTVKLQSVLQDWRNWIQSAKDYLMDQLEVDRLQAQDRPITPLLSPEQQAQVLSISCHHEARLQAQKQLSVALASLLKTAVAQRQVLLQRAREKLTIGPLHQSCPADLIPALRPENSDIKLDHGQPLAAVIESKSSGVDMGSVLKSSKSLLKATAGRAEISQPAYPPTYFHNSITALKPCAADALPPFSWPAGQGSKLATAFVPPGMLSGEGVESVKAAISFNTEQRWLAARQIPFHVSAQGADTTAASLPSSVAQTAPRRLSFSGLSPAPGAGGEQDSQTPPASAADLQDPANGVNQGAELSVEVLMTRMQRLRQIS